MKVVSKKDAIARAILDALQSPNECDSNGEIANLVDTTAKAARGLYSIAHAITADATPRPDATGGGLVASLTEAVMGVTAGLVRIANAIGDLAEAVRERDRD